MLRRDESVVGQWFGGEIGEDLFSVWRMFSRQGARIAERFMVGKAVGDEVSEEEEWATKCRGAKCRGTRSRRLGVGLCCGGDKVRDKDRDKVLGEGFGFLIVILIVLVIGSSGVA